MIKYRDKIIYTTGNGNINIESNVYIFKVERHEYNSYKVCYISQNTQTPRYYSCYYVGYDIGTGFIIDDIEVIARNKHLLVDKDIDKVLVNIYNHQMEMTLENID